MCILSRCVATLIMLWVPILCLPRLCMIVCFFYNGFHQCLLLQGLSQNCSSCRPSLTTCIPKSSCCTALWVYKLLHHSLQALIKHLMMP